MVHGDPGDCGSGAWDLFLIRDFVVQKIGLFDENFYPAYCEDYDYVMRMKSDDIKIIDSLDGTYYHGPTDKPDYNKHARQTLKTDPSLADGL
jgi:GT2 family glycosyltransferase